MHAHTHMHLLHVMFLLGIMGVPTLNTLNIKGGISAHICCWNRVEKINSACHNTHRHTLVCVCVCANAEEQRLTSGYRLIKTVPE